MGHGIGAGFGCNLDQPLRDERPRDGCAKQIKPFIDRVRPEHGKNEVAHEFFAHILDEDLRRTHHLGLPAGRFQLFALAQVGGEGDNLAAIFGLQPFQDDRGVETAGIGENDFLRCGHVLPRMFGPERPYRSAEDGARVAV